MEAVDCLRELLDAGMTQAQIAEKTNIPQPSLSRYARRKVQDLPSRRARSLQALWELEVGSKVRSAATA